MFTRTGDSYTLNEGEGYGKGGPLTGGVAGALVDSTGDRCERLEHPVTAVDDPVKTYLQAERRLREILLGDGTTTVGLVKGEERRIQTTRLLRRMRAALEELQTELEAAAQAGDLEEELRRVAAARSGEQPEPGS